MPEGERTGPVAPIAPPDRVDLRSQKRRLPVRSRAPRGGLPAIRLGRRCIRLFEPARKRWVTRRARPP